VSKHAFTLIEVLLALLLSVVLLTILATAISVHVRVVDKGRYHVEEAQLARALLSRIASDLRNTVRYQPVDLEKLVPNLPSSSGSGGQGGDNSSAGTGTSGSSKSGTGTSGSSKSGSGTSGTGTSGSGTSGTGTSGTGTSGTGTSGSGTSGSSKSGSGASGTGSTASAASTAGASSSGGSSQTGKTGTSSSDTGSTESSPLPGLRGTLNRLELDVSRVPRPEQSSMLLAAGLPGAGSPSDMKAVAYFMAEEQMGLLNTGLDQRHGLVRRELDRAASCWAAQQGQLEQIEQTLDPIAPEVAGVEFHYYDGQQWQDTWDSESQSGLPVAVEVLLTIARPPPNTARFGAAPLPAGANPLGAMETAVYRLVVNLPTATPAADSESSGTGQESTSP